MFFAFPGIAPTVEQITTDALTTTEALRLPKHQWVQRRRQLEFRLLKYYHYYINELNFVIDINGENTTPLFYSE